MRIYVYVRWIWGKFGMAMWTEFNCSCIRDQWQILVKKTDMKRGKLFCPWVTLNFSERSLISYSATVCFLVTSIPRNRLYKCCTLFDTAFFTLYLVLLKHFLISSLVSQMENCYLQHIFHLVDTGLLRSELFMSWNIQKPLGLTQMCQGQDWKEKYLKNYWVDMRKICTLVFCMNV